MQQFLLCFWFLLKEETIDPLGNILDKEGELLVNYELLIISGEGTQGKGEEAE